MKIISKSILCTFILAHLSYSMDSVVSVYDNGTNRQILAGGLGPLLSPPPRDFIISASKSIKKIVVKSHDYVDYIKIYEVNARGGRPDFVGEAGGRGGKDNLEIEFENGEYLTGISGICGWYIDQITFHTNMKAYGPYGGEGRTGIKSFNFRSNSNSPEEVFCIFGKCGNFIDSIGVLFRPRDVDSRPHNRGNNKMITQ